MVDRSVKIPSANSLADFSFIQITHQVENSGLGFLKEHGSTFDNADLFVSQLLLFESGKCVDVIKYIDRFGYS